MSVCRYEPGEQEDWAWVSWRRGETQTPKRQSRLIRAQWVRPLRMSPPSASTDTSYLAWPSVCR